MLWVRAGLIFLGILLSLFGIFKAWAEVKIWEVLSKLGERAPLVGTDTRIKFRLFLVVAAFGASMVAIAFIL